MRDSKTYQTSLYLTVAEEQTRMLALEAFKGLSVTTGDYHILKYQKAESDKLEQNWRQQSDNSNHNSEIPRIDWNLH